MGAWLSGSFDFGIPRTGEEWDIESKAMADVRSGTAAYASDVSMSRPREDRQQATRSAGKTFRLTFLYQRVKETSLWSGKKYCSVAGIV